MTKKNQKRIELYLSACDEKSNVTFDAVQMIIPYSKGCCCGFCRGVIGSDDRKDILLHRYDIIKIARAMQITSEELAG